MKLAPRQLAGLAALTLAQDAANAALCAEGVGAMEQTLKLTTEYMNQRKQFNTVIASFFSWRGLMRSEAQRMARSAMAPRTTR